MPSSKKPRKKYHRKKVSFGYFQDDIDNILGFFQHTDYAILEKLPKGTATLKEVDAMFDSFNTVLLSVGHRKDLSDESKRAIRDVLLPANTSVALIKKKGLKRRVFLATGDQLKSITEAAEIAFPYIYESIRTCTNTFLKEFFAAKELGD